MKALIDGDIVVFKSGFAAERRQYVLEHPAHKVFNYKKELLQYLKDEDIDDYEYYSERILSPVSHALSNAKNIIKRIIEEIKPTDYVLYLSGKDNFRRALSPDYKANRKETHRPIYEDQIKEFIVKHYRGEIINKQEADDALGIEQTRLKGKSIICSIDKDLNMIPGWHYNWDTANKYYIDEHTAITNFYIQLLSGDSVDNIRGVPSIGKVKATEYISPLPSYKEMEEEAIKLYKEAYKESWEEEILKNGRLLWIRRNPEELWNLNNVY